MTLRHAALVWTVLVLAVAGRVAVAPARSHTVTPIYWSAATRFLHNEPLYAPVDGLDVYLYTPGFAAGVVPFTWVPEKAAGILWRLLGVGLFLAGMRAVGRHLLGFDDRRLAQFFLLTIPLALSSLDNGQANLHLAGMVALGAAAFGRERWSAAVWIALAAGIKLYPITTGMLFGVFRPRWTVLLLIVSFGVVGTFPFVVTNAGYVLEQFQGLTHFADADDRLHSTSWIRVPRDWTILTRTWLGWIPDERTARIISAVAGIGLAGLVYSLRNQPGDRRTWIAFALGSVWMTLFGPATEPQTYSLLAATSAGMVLVGRGTARVFAVAAWCIFTGQVVRDAFPQGWQMSRYGTHPAAAGLLLIAVLVDSFGPKVKGDEVPSNATVPGAPDNEGAT